MKYLPILLTSVLLSACNLTQLSPQTLQQRLNGGYELQRINSQSVESFLGEDFRPESRPTLEFQQKFLLAGYSGCNRFFGQGELSGNVLRLASGGSTKMMCPGPQMQLEELILGALERGSQIELKGDYLKLKDGESELLFLKGYLP